MNPTVVVDNPVESARVVIALNGNPMQEAAMKRLDTTVTVALIATVGWLSAALLGCASPGLGPAPRPVTPAVTPSPTPTVSAFETACTQEVLLQTLKTRFDDPTTGLNIERADIRRCRDGYAHVYAVTERDNSGSARFENEQLFLRLVEGQWLSVAEGTGISCDERTRRQSMLPPASHLAIEAVYGDWVGQPRWERARRLPRTDKRYT